MKCWDSIVSKPKYGDNKYYSRYGYNVRVLFYGAIIGMGSMELLNSFILAVQIIRTETDFF
jgi:hypothetical protein